MGVRISAFRKWRNLPHSADPTVASIHRALARLVVPSRRSGSDTR